MLNLLTPQKKKELEGEYKKRRLVTVMSFVVGTLVTFSILLLPSFLLVKIRHAQAERESVTLKEQINFQKGQEKSLSEEDKKILELLDIKGQNPNPPTELIKLVVNNKGPGIKLNKIYVQIDGSRLVTISGIARTRDDLIKYRDKLIGEKILKNVNLPISALGPPRNSEFTMELIYQ
jgi:Tfp pilus assembly protein PilN